MGLLDARADDPRATRIQQQGPASLWLISEEKDPRHLPLSGELIVKLRVEAPWQQVELLDDLQQETPFWKLRPLPPRNATDPQAPWEQEYLLTPEQPGKHDLQMPRLSYRVGDEPAKTATWKRVTLHITTQVKKVAVSEAKGKPDIERLPDPPAANDWLVWALGGGVLVLLAVGGCLLIRYRSPVRPPLSAHEILRRQLQTLADDAAADRFHVALADALRAFVERQFALPASRRTTPEFAAALQESDLAPEQREALAQILERCDLAKFAPVLPGDERRDLLDLAWRFVDANSPQPSPKV